MASTSRKTSKSKDPCCKHGKDGTEKGMVVCNYCTQPSLEVENEVKALPLAYELKRVEKKRTAEAMEASISFFSSTGSECEGDRGSSSSIHIGPQNRGLGSVNNCNSNFFDFHDTPRAQPSLEGVAWYRELHHEAKLACAKFWYYNSIPFNVASSPYWKQLISALTMAGKGFKAPSSYDLSGPLLDDEVQNTYKLVEEQKQIWKNKGCSIIFDGWTDDKNNTLINFLVASGGQLVFLKSVDASNEVKNAETLCNLLDEMIMEVGVENVIQIVTNNASVYVDAGKLLETRHPTLFWSPCAINCLNLLLEDIVKLSWVKNVVEDARNVIKYIYKHTWVLNLMREHTNCKELTCTGVTDFATNFLTLQSIATTLPNLKSMFVSERWLESPYYRNVEAKRVMKTIFDDTFAKTMEEIIKVLEPLVRVLRLVDGDKSPMGYLYEAMYRAKEVIHHLYESNRTKYEPIWHIIVQRWNGQLLQHIHAAAYYLNPKFFFSPSFRANAEVMFGLHTCLERLVPNDNLRDLILDEMQSYKRAEGALFSSALCIHRRVTLQPDLWWEDFGATTPNLQKIAIHILSQPCSTFGCWRNWSVFEVIHTNKHNMLTQKRLNDLVFVRYNLRLHEKKVEGQDTHHAFDLDHIDTYLDWIVEDVDPLSTVDEMADSERDIAEWQVNVAAYEEKEGKVG